jgi:DNA-binding response OmpR family regulator
MDIPGPTGRQGRILLVEDDADAAYYATYVLTRMGGFKVSHTLDPLVALQRARSLPWDLVLTEVDLPGMTGAQLIDALRQAVPALPVVVMTACAPADASLDGLHRRADALLHKPVPPARLIAIAAALIDSGQPSLSSQCDRISASC